MTLTVKSHDTVITVYTCTEPLLYCYTVVTAISLRDANVMALKLVTVVNLT